MNEAPDPDFEERLVSRLVEALIRAGLILAMAALCFQIFSPFLHLMVWALILAVTLYPRQQSFAALLGNRQGLSATLVVLLGLLLFVVPTAALMSSLGESVHGLVEDFQNGRLRVPPPRDAVADWPVVGPRLHSYWATAHTDMPALVQGMEPQLTGLAKAAARFVASIGAGLLTFLASLVVAGVMMAYGETGAQGCRAIFRRVAGRDHGDELADLSTATIRAVAKGVLGVAFIQAALTGICFLIAGVPWAAALAAVVLVLGIAQIPTFFVTLPVLGYIWSGGDYGSGEAVVYTAMLLITGMADNVLKPLLLGRGVAVPMPVILLGALGGMASGGLVGIFVGPTLLAVAYQIFMDWVATGPDAPLALPDGIPSDRSLP